MINGSVLFFPGNRQQLSFFLQFCECSTRLDDQAVGGDVLRLPVNGFRQIVLPFFRRLSGEGADQVNVYVFKARFPGLQESCLCLGRSMDPSQKTEFIIMQRLYADGQAVDTGLTEGAQLIRFCRARIHFQTDLRIRPHRKRSMHRLHDPADLLFCQD